MKKLSILFLCILLVGCSNKNEQEVVNETITSVDSNDYSIVLPFEVSLSRYWFANTLSKMDAIEMPKGLQEHAKKHFDVKNNYLKAGSLLSYDDIQMLQRRESANYPYALNPAEGEFKVSDNKSVISPYIVSGVYEINFVSKEDSNKLSGIALSIMLDSEITQTVDGVDTNVIISHDYLMAYGSTIGHKLERFIRNKPEVEADLPIYITLYDAQTGISYTAGNYFAEAMFTGRSGQFSEINEKWYILPSDEVMGIDGILANKFQTVKSSVSQFMPENVSFIGSVKYKDNYPVFLKIEMITQAKSYTEVYALAQYVSDLAKTFDQEGLEVVIEIDQLDKTMFIISKGADDSQFTVQDMN